MEILVSNKSVKNRKKTVAIFTILAEGLIQPEQDALLMY